MVPQIPDPCEDDGQDHRCPPAAALPPPWPYPPLPPPASHGRSTFVTALIIATSVLVFLALCLSILVFVRRRRLRRRREALLEAALAPAAAATFPDEGDGDGGPGGEVVHHVWHIRTVGLDNAAIESIALTRYRAGGVLGASDCTVCLGEFQDGELLRLLPKCAHAFHVECIDTWLRAHVSCPLCRADVMDPGAAAADADAEQPPGTDAADASAERSASNTPTTELERLDQQANEHHQELRVQIDQPDHSSSLELERRRRQVRHHGARAQNFRRVASMDSRSPPPVSAEVDPEGEPAGREEQGTCGAVCCEVSPEPAELKRSWSASSRWTLL
jgi:hypothetical protein